MSRIEKIKTRLFEKEFYTKKEFWGAGSTILTSDEVKAEPLVIRKAIATAYVLDNMPAEIKDDELIVGIANMASIGFGRVFPEYATKEEKAEAYKKGFSYKSCVGHFPPDFDGILQKGLKGIKEEIYEKIKEESAMSTPDHEKLDYYRAMLITLDSLSRLSQRYVNLVIKAAQNEKDLKRRAELYEIARVCSKVPENPAETFQEAVQSSWFVFIATHSTLDYIPVARADQYLYPYYKKDIESGCLTREEAKEIVGSWLAKYSERVQMNKAHWENHTGEGEYALGGDPEDNPCSFEMENTEEYNYGSSANHWLVNLIIGGVDRDGNDATNDLTFDILEQWAYLELVCPVLSVRISQKTPEAFVNACAKVVRKGSGEPALYNDEVIIQGLVERGIPIEDAREYSNDGCWEVLIPGKSHFAYYHIEMLKLLEFTLFNGKSLVTKTKEGHDQGDPTRYKTFEELYQAYLEQVTNQMKRILKIKTEYFKFRSQIAPSPLYSALTQNCIQKGKDVYTGGAVYDFFSFIVTAIANCVDSLNAIKMMVYEKQKISMADLLTAIETNFEGQEALRQTLVHHVPKFGNDDDYADSLCTRILDDVVAIMKDLEKKNDMGEALLGLGIGTFENYQRFGHNCGASADGRKYQETVSSNYSPAIGMDINGPTAAIKSATKTNLVPFFTGCPLDMQINSNEVEGEAGMQRLSAVIRSFNNLGGNILTVTGVSTETLKAAQVEPMKHQGLRVRMGGLSAYFIQLSKEMQDTMIHRVKHSV